MSLITHGNSTSAVEVTNSSQQGVIASRPAGSGIGETMDGELMELIVGLERLTTLFLSFE